MLLTGRSLFHIQGEGEEVPAAHVTMGECFGHAGYETYGVGKWHNGKPGFNRSFAGGDEIFFGGMWDHWNLPTFRFDPTGQYAATLPMVSEFYTSNRVTTRYGDHVTAGVHSTDLLAEAVLRFLRGRRQDQPFFLHLAFLAPHDPRTMPQRFRDLYDPAKIELPENFVPESPVDTGELQGRDERLAANPRDPAEVRRHIAEYYAMISHADDALGRLVACLRETGQYDDTILVFTADHGLALGQHGLMGKQDLYDHSIRVPLILAGPGVPANQRRDALVYSLDLFPTLCDLTGVTVPPSVEAQSLAGCLAGDGPGREWLYLAYCHTIRGVKNRRHKLIEYCAHGKRATQLFDLANDPKEMHNLAGRPETRALVSQLRRRLLAMRDELEDRTHPRSEAYWKNVGELA
jgi:arylsulfatase A-like enzyme